MWAHRLTNNSPPALGVEVESKVDRDRANAWPLALQDHAEPIALVAVPAVEDPASHTRSHAFRQERVEAELRKPVPALLPSVLRLVVFEPKSFEVDIQ